MRTPLPLDLTLQVDEAMLTAHWQVARLTLAHPGLLTPVMAHRPTLAPFCVFGLHCLPSSSDGLPPRLVVSFFESALIFVTPAPLG